jgi:hypothetical protein
MDKKKIVYPVAVQLKNLTLLILIQQQMFGDIVMVKEYLIQS